MIQITRRETFNAAHRLYNTAWTEEKNKNFFGECSGIHGHNWELFVTVKGDVNPETGVIIDFKLLSRVMKEEVTHKVDHTYLNENEFMKGLIPSVENFTIIIWEVLKHVLKEKYGVDLYCVKLVETANHYAEYYG